MTRLRAAVANERGFLNTFAFFLFKARTNGIAKKTGFAISVTDDDFVTSINLFAIETMNTKVVRVDKTPTVVSVDNTIKPNFFRYGRRILT